MATANGSSKGPFEVPKVEVRFTKLFIDGKFVDAVSGKTFETRDPRTGEVIASIAEGGKADVDLAVKAAREAFDNGPWPRMTGYERGRILHRFADLIDEHVEELAALDTVDAGKLFAVGKARDIPGAAHLLRYYAGAADKVHGATLKMAQRMHGYTLKEPVGVVGHIVPWNYPTTMFFFKVGPALAAGCAVVVKPAEQTPLSALFYAHLAREAGVPAGVLNVVPGFGPTAGAAVAAHMDVDKVSFTGSTEVGRLVMRAAAESNLKPVSLELGGKSPVIVFDDADLDMAVNLVNFATYTNKGEICVAGTRIYVQEGIYDEFVKKAAELASKSVVGDPFNPSVSQGPQVDKDQYEKVLRTVEEVIQKANNTRYGLAAGIVTKNIDVANTVSRSIRAGAIWINCYFAFDPDAPFGGYKMSGFGKDMGMDALDKYLQTKTVVTPLYNTPWL
ncbi:aldehyde dehydrogenase3 [Zea mays]|uniref:Aldehyde dehydrogenase 1 n=1 Tax=Zea mays TaxID=4577 RepID=A0A1D6NL28_MAIZE|nr:aldehyde dehydrogenase3 [Zea mays]